MTILLEITAFDSSYNQLEGRFEGGKGLYSPIWKTPPKWMMISKICSDIKTIELWDMETDYNVSISMQSNVAADMVRLFKPMLALMQETVRIPPPDYNPDDVAFTKAGKQVGMVQPPEQSVDVQVKDEIVGTSVLARFNDFITNGIANFAKVDLTAIRFIYANLSAQPATLPDSMRTMAATFGGTWDLNDNVLPDPTLKFAFVVGETVVTVRGDNLIYNGESSLIYDGSYLNWHKDVPDATRVAVESIEYEIIYDIYHKSLSQKTLDDVYAVLPLIEVVEISVLEYWKNIHPNDLMMYLPTADVVVVIRDERIYQGPGIMCYDGHQFTYMGPNTHPWLNPWFKQP
jgi:hypothetical protein